jgi:hypothetical protein
MAVVTTLDITDLTVIEYRAVLDELGVERHPDTGIYLHLAHANGPRISHRRDLGPPGRLQPVPRRPPGARDEGRWHEP